ncbi:lateral flagellar hook protein 2 [Duganella sp. BJB488]|uniref:flagellar filament capping protein FliD n=1 Tax=unclassified Duganella TaxID=2636909 RepID=UPI000E3451ED|nr:MULTISPECIES: flagellar filament capping protein FliD [unclassified Duganella]RFP10236.1 lateral flagellar hook protein 2 [Duganella sp. BJB489]RFP18165.1 lateral flagellar hook protein 2 [Duganella sp. BJB488]RFP37926.1 lateral flagellar hook protein 2 [Duganella sp. BJB480]
MAVISSPTYDPQTTATNLANAYVAPTKANLDARNAQATATVSALTTLGSALSAFQSSIQSLVTGTASVSAAAAASSNTAIATGTAGANAVAGTYSFYVEQLATAGQVSYNVNDSAATNAGSLKVMLADGSNFQVDLANADSNMDGKLSAKEIAAAINVAATNNSRVTASTMTINGQTKLVMTSTQTGANNAVSSIDVSGLADAGLQSDLSTQKVESAAKDAIVWMGDQNTGTKVTQASNTFSTIDNVKFTVKQAQTAGATPVQLTVGPDNTTTAANVQAFVDAYNKLLGVFKTVTAAGDHTPTSPTDSSPRSSDAALHGDSGVTALQAALGSALRAVTGGKSLISFGITAARDGSLSLDTARLQKTVAADPGKIDTLFGRAGLAADAGVLGKMNKLVTTWTNSATGLIGSRKTAATKVQDDVAKRQIALQTQFDNSYKRYLAQFSALQQLQSSMTSTSNMFTAMFSPNSSN